MLKQVCQKHNLQLECLYITFFCVTGIGFGFIYVPAVIATGFYFEKRRALATGIAVCGSGIGNFVFAPLNNFLLGSVSWRWTMVVYAGKYNNNPKFVWVPTDCFVYSVLFMNQNAVEYNG